jgi:hypothetical protein
MAVTPKKQNPTDQGGVSCKKRNLRSTDDEQKAQVGVKTTWHDYASGNAF